MPRPDGPTPFYFWMVKRYGKQLTTGAWVWKSNRFGELAYDMHCDSDFPRSSCNPQEILDYLAWPALACSGAMCTAKAALKVYRKAVTE